MIRTPSTGWFPLPPRWPLHGQAGHMFTPGQLVRHQRLRRGWSQEQLGQAAGLAQTNVSRYEAELRYPSWPMLCRLLGAMGMQPRVIAEPCDISQHEVSAWARSDLEERVFGTPTPWGDEEIDLAALLSPQVSEGADPPLPSAPPAGGSACAPGIPLPRFGCGSRPERCRRTCWAAPWRTRCRCSPSARSSAWEDRRSIARSPGQALRATRDRQTRIRNHLPRHPVDG
jgi:transcriptional regulator with XRE-family HTH domain